MVHNPLLVAALSAGLLAPLASGMYAKNSPVLQLDAKNFESKILNSGHESIVEFYAPWCGHCKNLKPAYEKAAENLKGLANVAAIDCDEDKNKKICQEYGIQGFPTLKSFRPAKVGAKPQPMDYQGPRTAKGIVDFVLDQIPNYVARVNSKTVENFLTKHNETTKAILFTTKGVATPLYKALAIDFRNSISFAQIRDKETDAVSIFGVEKYPTLVVLPGGDKDSVVYDGEMKKDAMFKFLSGFAEPTEGKEDKKTTKKETKKDSKKDTKADSKADEPPAAESPVAPPKPSWDATIPPLGAISEFVDKCSKKTCVLVITPSEPQPMQPYEETNYYLHNVKPNLFPFFQLPASSIPDNLKAVLEIENVATNQMRAINGKRGWWVGYSGDANTVEAMKNWVDALRLGELSKKKIPSSGFESTAGQPEAEKVEEPVKEEKAEEPVKEAPKHEEL